MSSGKEMMEPAPVAPPPCFDGFYIGIHGAGLFEPEGKTQTFAQGVQFTQAGAPPGIQNRDISRGDSEFGGAGGVHAGFNRQSGMWVFGIEADLSFADLEQHGGTAFAHQGDDLGGPDHLGVIVNSETEIKAFGTLRPRGGIVLGQRFLIFGTGGVVGAWDNSRVEERILYQFPSDDPEHFRLKKSRTRDIDGGWTAGGGFDFCLKEHWLLNFTYLYCDLGDREPTQTNVFHAIGGPHDMFHVRAQNNILGEIQFHVFQAGLSYKF
jgi:outer membrane immunogenic protein